MHKHLKIRAFQVRPYPSLGGLEAVLRDLYLTFSSFGHFSSLGKNVGWPANGSSATPMGALRPTAGDQAGICEFSGIRECFDSTYGFALPRN